MIRDLLVVLSHAPSDAAALQAARVLADDHDAHLAALVCVPLTLPIAFEWSAIPADLYAGVHAAERERGRRAAERARAALQATRLPAEVRVVETSLVPPSHVAALHARHADLVLVGGPGPDAGPAEALFLDLVLDSGRPVLVVPSGHAMAAAPAHAVVAWQPTREAARALHDSMSLLRRARRVDVVLVDPVSALESDGDDPGVDIARHLARHGLRVELVVRAGQDIDAADILLRHVREAGADLVVAGAWSHARLREAVLGGATRTLLARCPVPVLFSH